MSRLSINDLRKMVDMRRKRATRRRVPAMKTTQETIVKRLQERIEAMQTNAFQTATQAGLGATFVSDILNGKNKMPSVGAMMAIGRVLDTDLGYFTGEQDVPRRTPAGATAEIPVIGYAWAGTFQTMVDFQDHAAAGSHDQTFGATKVVTAPRSRRHPNARLFAVQIMGDSMNAARPRPLLDGDIALCVDLKSAGLEIESGQIYAVRRTKDHGQTWECTIKRAKVFRDRYELWPESTNQNHQPIVIPRHGANDDGTEIEAIGLVYLVSYNFEDTP